ncbi:hypothetical protein PHYPSEUDO_012059 [Phytophthora pseudosyringae]|uniref:Uncharacterized protein n=1 Tax=Phytophthora pseudosyringae TaxID=221518 RepID=A0A8T1V7C3_9STRA|nr:hypothetical protein PHYPSEUDO_012059 [Phytophthora pseudosyringae]
MWTSVTQIQIDRLAIEAFMPVVLLLNYTLLLYLAKFYWNRRRERRVTLLLVIGVLGTVIIIPFAKPDEAFVKGVNDVSEACCVLTFLLQITIIGYDLNKKFKMRSVMYLTYMAELLILGDLTAILISCIVVSSPGILSENTAQAISNAAENANLAFIFIFRFYYIGISRGWRSIVKSRKFEVCCYVLFATHELPFNVLSISSGLDWEFAQAIWHRTTLTACLLITARTKIKRFSGVSSTANVGSTSSEREKRSNRKGSTRLPVGLRNLFDGKGPTRLGSRNLFDGKATPRLDFLVQKSGKSGGRRSSGPQICAVAPMKNLEDPQ